MRTKRNATTTSDLEMRYRELWALAQTAPHFIGTKGWSAWLDRLDGYKPDKVISGSLQSAGKVKKSGVGAPCGDCR